jgi:tRNA dimethylallyltransferase
MERIAYVIVGPTCSGKTTFSIELAKKINGEIISADSRQFYKLLDIGTAKPTPEELSEVKHHLVDFISPKTEYNVSRFEEDSLKIIESLFKEKKTPVIVGGSGLYIRAVVEGLFNEIDTDEEYREYLNELRTKFGNAHIYGILKEVDPVSAEKMLPQNWKRVMRALEVFHISGEPIWKFQKEHKRETDIEFRQFGLNWPREILYKNIETRVDKMIDLGLVDEVKSILANGYHENINALNTVGYKEIISYLKGEYSLERAIELIKRNTRHYAKRQMTWFRKDESINWLDINSNEDLFKQVSRIATESH